MTTTPTTERDDGEIEEMVRAVYDARYSPNAYDNSKSAIVREGMRWPSYTFKPLFSDAEISRDALDAYRAAHAPKVEAGDYAGLISDIRRCADNPITHAPGLQHYARKAAAPIEALLAEIARLRAGEEEIEDIANGNLRAMLDQRTRAGKAEAELAKMKRDNKLLDRCQLVADLAIERAKSEGLGEQLARIMAARREEDLAKLREQLTNAHNDPYDPCDEEATGAMLYRGKHEARTNAVDPIVEAVRADLLIRSQLGISKYGVTLARDDLTQRAWLQHALEESLDLACYLKRMIVDIEEGCEEDAKGGVKP